MKRGLYLLMIVWLLAAGVCGVVYQVRGDAKSSLLTQEEADAMVHEAKEETRREVLAEIDAREAAQASSEDTWVTTTAGQKAEEEADAGEDEFVWEEDGVPADGTEAADGAEAADEEDASAEAEPDEEPAAEEEDPYAWLADLEDEDAAPEGESGDPSDLISPEEWAVILAAMEEQGPYYRVTVTEAEKVWLRSEPMTESGQIKTIRKGTKGYLIEDMEGWALIWIDNQVGYMAKAYLSREEIPADEYPQKLRDVTKDDAGDVLYLDTEG